MNEEEKKEEIEKIVSWVRTFLEKHLTPEQNFLNTVLSPLNLIINASKTDNKDKWFVEILDTQTPRIIYFNTSAPLDIGIWELTTPEQRREACVKMLETIQAFLTPPTCWIDTDKKD